MSKADIVNSWFAQKLGSGGPLARDTDAYNQVFAALPDLVARLDAVAPVVSPVVEPTSDNLTPPDPAAGKKG